MVQGLEFRVYGLGFRVKGLGYNIKGLGFRIYDGEAHGVSQGVQGSGIFVLKV